MQHDTPYFEGTDAVEAGAVVLIAVTSACIIAMGRDGLDEPELEALFIELLLPRVTTLLGCIYCPPNARESAYHHLDATLSCAATNTCRNIVILGDSNTHADWWDHDDTLPSESCDDLLLNTMCSAGHSKVYRSPIPCCEQSGARAVQHQSC
ncbi:hypothetical protein HPB49_017986 [Dermacentor silvarum]|uniref:Uncharacterized protein n=1 Tax=Dermacentor silvarum TaxID=543639 RepID=A0ACB8E2A3_DERSI|nr:hypothetical protein HPB49_017986 [Dermacentor silvarum]